MNDTFELPVHFEGEEIFFTSQLIQLGYIHKFLVNVNGQPIYFEPDEERCYRAILDTNDIQTAKSLNVSLLKAVAEAIERVTK